MADMSVVLWAGWLVVLSVLLRAAQKAVEKVVRRAVRLADVTDNSTVAW